VRFRIEQRFRHDVERVEAALLDPAFLARMAELPKLGRPELLGREEDGTEVRMRVRYAFAGELSSAVRRVVDPARLTWVEESTTDRTTHQATFRIVPDHYGGMLRCQGTFALTPSATGSTRLAEGELRVSVPLVGGKVERAIVSGLEEHALAEASLVDAWLGPSS
jgi:uncharacterized protein YndB with AHSA1/START domain